MGVSTSRDQMIAAWLVLAFAVGFLLLGAVAVLGALRAFTRAIVRFLRRRKEASQ